MKWFIDYSECSTPRIIAGVSSEPAMAWGSGTILIPALRPEGRTHMELKDIWFAPEAPHNLLSVT